MGAIRPTVDAVSARLDFRATVDLPGRLAKPCRKKILRNRQQATGNRQPAIDRTGYESGRTSPNASSGSQQAY
jgi:hypothetical protein